MKVLLDENVPEVVLHLLQKLSIGHQIHHVAQLDWRGKKDILLLADAKRKHFEAFLTGDISQYDDPDECKAVKRSGMHHITFESHSGPLSHATLVASLCAATPTLLNRLANETGQRIATIAGISTGGRFSIKDPMTDPPSNYWPGSRTFVKP